MDIQQYITKSNRNIKRMNEKMENNYDKIQEKAEKIRELNQEIINLSDENMKLYKDCVKQETGVNVNVSYKDKYAKETFKKWINEWHESTTNIEYESNGEICNESIEWGRSCYSSGVYIDYPLDNDSMDWYENLLDDGWLNAEIERTLESRDVVDPLACPGSYRPGVYKAIVDFATTRKGCIQCIIDIYDKYPISNKKIETIKKLRLGDVEYYGIDADWILSQTGIPSKLKVKKIL